MKSPPAGAGGVRGGPVQDKAYDRLPTERSRALRNNATAAERKLWGVLRNRQLEGVPFNRQVPIGPYICDFAARSVKLLVELDGGQHALSSAYDEARSAFLIGKGYRVLRFWNNEVLGNIDGVVASIVENLSDTPSPDPSRPAGGEEVRSTEGEGLSEDVGVLPGSTNP